MNATELVNPQCTTCLGTPEVRQSNHLFIDLPKIQPELESWFDKKKEQWSSNAVSFTNTFLKSGLEGRCITRDLKWGTPVPLERMKDKVFYVWFDAPIGYISITASYTDEWKQWWQNESEVELYQFMGKDNITFHTVIFPSTLIGTGQPWTKLNTVSTTEFLNYEIDEKTGKPKKFSKSRNSGVFGDDAMNTGVPCEVWRYYLLINRPENQDTVFLWSDFLAKNNNELLANLGNFSNRILKFLVSAFKKVVPGYKGDVHANDAAFIANLMTRFRKYCELMEQTKLKDGLRAAMAMSSECNTYIQENQPWVLNKSDAARCAQVMATAINALMLLCIILEPFMPSFSAKVYEQMNWVRKAEHETAIESLLKRDSFMGLVPGDHVIGTPEPIFREIKEEEILAWKKQFGGD
jgi:methionyl-tRNA synthetase